MKTPISLAVTRFLLPFIYIFSFYIMIFGHLSPGGGFAGGSVLGAGLILQHALLKDEPDQKRIGFLRGIRWIVGALLIYGTLKSIHFYASPHGHNLIHIPVGQAGRIFSGGTLMPLNILIGFVVGITFYLIGVMFEDGGVDHA